MDFRQTSASCINFCPGLFFFTWHKDLSEKTCLGQASYQDILNVWMFLAFKPETGRTGGEATASYVLHIAKSEIPEQQRWTQVGYFSSLRSERYGTPLNKKQVKERQYLHEKNVNNYTDLYDVIILIAMQIFGCSSGKEILFFMLTCVLVCLLELFDLIHLKKSQQVLQVLWNNSNQSCSPCWPAVIFKCFTHFSC